jgi:hypothetical protein
MAKISEAERKTQDRIRDRICSALNERLILLMDKYTPIWREVRATLNGHSSYSTPSPNLLQSQMMNFHRFKDFQREGRCAL